MEQVQALRLPDHGSVGVTDIAPLAVEQGDGFAFLKAECIGAQRQQNECGIRIHAVSGDVDVSSGFLALDKNGDGRINDGSELFGAKTGDGFSELAAYDQDGSGWIDEGDEIFSRLKVWTKCGTDDARLLSLSEADVGAIFLGSQNTQYSLPDSCGDTGAMIRKTGLYLKESGGAGTVQHVDFKA